jgi:hypothetical protein
MRTPPKDEDGRGAAEPDEQATGEPGAERHQHQPGPGRREQVAEGLSYEVAQHLAGGGERLDVVLGGPAGHQERPPLQADDPCGHRFAGAVGPAHAPGSVANRRSRPAGPPGRTGSPPDPADRTTRQTARPGRPDDAADRPTRQTGRRGRPDDADGTGDAASAQASRHGRGHPCAGAGTASPARWARLMCRGAAPADPRRRGAPTVRRSCLRRCGRSGCRAG